jgi:hypothetical protein
VNAFTVQFVVQGHIGHGRWVDLIYYFDEAEARTYLQGSREAARRWQAQRMFCTDYRIIKRIEEVLP